MTRGAERVQAWLDAQQESLNKNGMVTNAPSPVSTRSAEEAKRTLDAPDPEPMTREHSVAAGCARIQYVGNVRSRIEVKQSKERDKKQERPSILETKNAQEWADYNERYKAKYGEYPPN